MLEALKIDVMEYLDEDEVRDEARGAIRRYFLDQITKNNMPYKVIYEAVAESGLDFKPFIQEKIDAWAADKSTYCVTSSGAFEKVMADAISENKQMLANSIAKRIEELDSYDISQYVSDTIAELLAKGATAK